MIFIFQFFFNFNTPLEFAVKSCQNSQKKNTSFFREKNEKKNDKDLGFGQNLTKFAKIPMPESLKILYIFF
jgi:hypothetical protein